MLLYLIIVLVGSSTSIVLNFLQSDNDDNNNNDITIGKFSVIITSFISGPLFYITWNNYMKERPALAKIPNGQTLLSAGFKQLYNTFDTIRCNLPTVQYFLISLLFSEPADTAFSIVGTTFSKCIFFLEGENTPPPALLFLFLLTHKVFFPFSASLSFSLGLSRSSTLTVTLIPALYTAAAAAAALVAAVFIHSERIFTNVII